ncbi:SHOCT domain-containing protein [Streptomyces sp. NPDC054854]
MVMRRRMGRPGLLGTMARTAVVAGTATAVSGRMQRTAAERGADQQTAADAREQELVDRTAAQVPVAAPAPPAVDRVGQLTQLAELKAQGILTEAEFAAEKARILSG